MVFLSVQRVLSKDGRGRGGGRLNPLATFLPLLDVKMQKTPPSFLLFHFGPLTFNFVFGPDFCYISFDLM